MGYEDILTQRLMLQDRIRTESYRDAIAKIVRRGDRVIDFGCGTGILSFFAVQSGAGAVHAVDETNIVRVAKLLADENGFRNISFYHDDAMTFEIAEKADVLISEWMGCFVFHEWMLAPLIHVRDRFLKENGTMIPRKVSLKIGLITEAEALGEPSFFTSRPFGVDFGSVAEWPMYSVLQRSIQKEQLSPIVLDVGTLDMRTCGPVDDSFSGRARLEKTTRIWGLCGWFDADLCDGVQFGTGPFDPPTHWDQLIFPLAAPITVEAGGIVEAGVFPSRREGDKATLWRWSLASGESLVEMDNFVHQAWLQRDLARGKLS